MNSATFGGGAHEQVVLIDSAGFRVVRERMFRFVVAHFRNTAAICPGIRRETTGETPLCCAVKS